MANVTNEEEEMWMVFSTISTLSHFLSVSYKVSLNTLNEINVLYSIIDRLPRKSEFDEIRTMVEKQKENIITTLVPIKEAFEKSAEYENFGRKMNDKKD
ncbi:hypothetical protein NSIN_10032 [Nitrosotalea sinensis]|uniref:Uncharacterized protein n=1 Tax=Nitrosotalea sinensis TaxID=1499975 RepID=A0A2H1EEQ2_9ARCH|nr:hypothetical protein [Candidatus Nitrosotalea sinensis]SHO42494.1 hypothetical protein NSIN_10032 [Candidatus Nitrosotalea sinensis]